MEKEEDFFYVGMDFVNPNENIRIKNNKTLSDQEQKLNDMKDDHERNHTIIRIEPDKNMPIPDTTGNGIDCTRESFNDFSIEGEILNDTFKLDETSYNTFVDCTNIIKDTDKIISNTYEKHKFDTNKRNFMDVLFNKCVRSKYSFVNTKYNYQKYFKYEILVEMFDNLRKAINALDFRNEQTYCVSIRSLGSKFLTSLSEGFNCESIERLIINEKWVDCYNLLNDIIGFELKHKDSLIEICLGNMVATKERWPEEKKLLKDVINDTGFIDDFMKFQESMIESYRDYKLKLKKYAEDSFFYDNLKNVQTANSEGLYCVTEFLYYYTISVCKIITDINKDFQSILLLIEPNSNYTKSSRIIDQIENIDPWISTDYHLLEEYLKGSSNDTERSEEIIRMHNKYVKENDYFVFLGDISEQEFFDESRPEYLEYRKKLYEMCKRLNGKKIIITGNNDTGTDNYYKKLGFIEVIREPVLLGRHVLSHEPIKTDKGILNIHGHIHGSKEYWNIDYKDHIDAYYGIYGHPVKLSYLDNYYESGKYTGCKTVKKEY